jgi:hypothetical protein
MGNNAVRSYLRQIKRHSLWEARAFRGAQWAPLGKDFAAALNRKGSGQNRIRTLDTALEPQSLIESGTQGGTQNYSDLDLAKIVTVWPSLAPAIKAAINALINHQP